MTEINSHNLMVRIDGDRVKKLREQKGLTQLYVATAVQVTTDTISRWENKRYPTIKKENGLRLAAALEVELEDILEVEPQGEVQKEEQKKLPPGTAQEAPQSYKRTFRWSNFFLLTGSAILLAVILVLTFFNYNPSNGNKLFAERILPPHCIAGQPFPVAIEIRGAGDNQLALIVKEQIPDDLTIHATQPKAPPTGNGSKHILRWLGKISQDSLYIYIASVPENSVKTAHFSGTFAVSTDKGEALPLAIKGNDVIAPGRFHWADTDKDNSISDTEILTVYDRYGELDSLKEDIDRIEEIWLGSGYRWNEQKKKYEILP
jgi:transcriptional regulator with XRE-family HTH domain